MTAAPPTTAPATTSAATTTPSGITRRPGRWIDGWNPEDPAQWQAEGRQVAGRNLRWSIFA